MAFKKLFEELTQAKEEAASNNLFLSCLKKYFEKLNTMDDFGALMDLFRPIF